MIRPSKVETHGIKPPPKTKRPPKPPSQNIDKQELINRRSGKMKIIAVDNFARESVADVLIAENVNEYWGKRIVDDLNQKQHENSQVYFKLVKDDYRLWRGMEELV